MQYAICIYYSKYEATISHTAKWINFRAFYSEIKMTFFSYRYSSDITFIDLCAELANYEVDELKVIP